MKTCRFLKGFGITRIDGSLVLIFFAKEVWKEGVGLFEGKMGLWVANAEREGKFVATLLMKFSHQQTSLYSIYISVHNLMLAWGFLLCAAKLVMCVSDKEMQNGKKG